MPNAREETSSHVEFDPFDISLRMCDDEGIVSHKPVDEERTLDKSYLDRHNRIAGPTLPNGDPRPHYPVTEPFACTSHAHLMGLHIQCTSPAHRSPTSRLAKTFEEVDQPQTFSQNRRGQWVPAIPLPYYGLLRKKCSCGAKFWTMEGYRGHYGLKHILDPD